MCAMRVHHYVKPKKRVCVSVICAHQCVGQSARVLPRRVLIHMCVPVLCLDHCLRVRVRDVARLQQWVQLSVGVCANVCMCVPIGVHVQTRVRTRVGAYTHVYAYKCVCVGEFVRVRVCEFVCM